MDTGLVIQLLLLVFCLLAAGSLAIVLGVLGLAFVGEKLAMAGDGSSTPPATAKERWCDRLFVVGAILVTIVIVALLIAAFGILWNILGLPMAVIVTALCVLGFLRWAELA